MRTWVDPGAVLAWGLPRMRDLPWRAERDPWRILVAEVMLQQTQASRVIPKWTAFLSAYPTPRACAQTSLGDILRLWQGLGYPRRAKNLQATARIVTDQYHGVFPGDLKTLLALPGIGPYTARALLAFAFEHDVAEVDTNIARILARTAGERLTTKGAQGAADALVPHGHGWLWNQVLMDLGAEVCRPVPHCEQCPVIASCDWNAAGRVGPDPAIGSAGVSAKQPRFEGSDRQERGKVLRSLSSRTCPVSDFEPGIVDGLVAEGLVKRNGSRLSLPS
jgi:A/G-specific adenine glycosylase